MSLRSAALLVALALGGCSQRPDLVIDVSRTANQPVTFRTCRPNDGGPLDCMLQKNDLFEGKTGPISIGLRAHGAPVVRVVFATLVTISTCLRLDVPVDQTDHLSVALMLDAAAPGGATFTYTCPTCTQLTCP